MAKITTCDGTDVEIPADTPITGLFGRQYSDAARPIAEKYLEEFDELHTKIAREMQAGIEALRARYRGELRQLPDDVL